MSDVVDLLADLVALPSVNPGGRDVSGPDYTEQAVIDRLAAFLQEHRIDYERQEVLPHRENLIAMAEGKDRSQTVFLESHADTVAVEGMTIAPFDPVVRDGRLYGRGSCDAKGQLAAMFTALARLLQQGGPATNVAVIAGCDEEYQFRGVAHLIQSGFRASRGVVGEPTELNLIIAHKGCARWRLHVRGKPAHSSNPHLGDNAISKMVPVITALEDYQRELQERPAHPLTGKPTLAITLIQGGSQINVVPDHCWIAIDRRLVPGEEATYIQAEVAAAIRRVTEVELEWEEVILDYSMEIDPQERIVQELARAVQNVTGRQPALQGVSYGTDASKFVRAGMPTVVFGPGSIARAHTAEEYIEIDQLEQAVEIYSQLLQGV